MTTGKCGVCKPGFFGDFCKVCKCGNSQNETVCDVSTGKCDLCKDGFGGHFCPGKQGFFMEVGSTTTALGYFSKFFTNVTKICPQLFT